MRSPILPFTLASGLIAVGGVAQQMRVVAPVVVVPGQTAKAASSDEDPGTSVEMFENPNLDRYLRRAQSFLDLNKYDSAIQVLQDVIEGNTVEFVVAGPGAEAAGKEGDPAAKPDAKPDAKAGTAPEAVAKEGAKEGTKEGERRKSAQELDAAQSVFSSDGRVYRPVRRLCHEILAQLPIVGLELYRASYEVQANELLAKALKDGSISSLEQVANRFFITIPAGKAMILLADRLMQAGRYRAAVQVLRDLVEVYPKVNRPLIGLNEVWCRFKIALCLRLAGEVAAAQTAVAELAKAFPDDSLRIAGELQAVKDLPQSDVFAGEILAAVAGARDAENTWLTDATESLVPLWQFRFHNPDPYREPKAVNNNNGAVFMGEGTLPMAMPHAARYAPSSWITFTRGTAEEPPRAMFLEHFRLRVVDISSGVLLQEGDGVDEPPAARENYPRVRIAASDFALLRPVEDEARCYVVLGHSRQATQSVEVLKASELVAYRRQNLERAWTSAQWLDGEDGLRDVTFLAAPTVFGERLLLPALRRDSYSLECLERTTGRPLWHTMLHSGGTQFFKAPGAPVVVQGGIAFVTTNAGCLAAVDAFAGDLRWIRRYERQDPLRPRTRAKNGAQDENMRYGVMFLQNDLPGFMPNDLIVRDGLVIVAPCDGNMLMCLDGATGQVQWMFDATTRYAPFSPLRQLVGTTATDLFAVSDKQLACFGLQGGLLQWSCDLGAWDGSKSGGRGRGAVVGDCVVIPGERELLVFDVANKKPKRRVPLPAFGESRDPLAGSCQVVSSGPWLALGYAGGIEMFSSSAALQHLAAATADPMQKADLLRHAGDSGAAEEQLRTFLQTPGLAEAQHTHAAANLLEIVKDRARHAARSGDKQALQQLDSVLPFATDHTVRLNWHLARLEVCKDANDMHQYEIEQQRLYDFMEGKG